MNNCIACEFDERAQVVVEDGAVPADRGLDEPARDRVDGTRVVVVVPLAPPVVQTTAVCVPQRTGQLPGRFGWRTAWPAGLEHRRRGRSGAGPSPVHSGWPPMPRRRWCRSPFVQNLRHGHYELAADASPSLRFVAPLRNRIHRARAGHVTCASATPTVASSAGRKRPLPGPPPSPAPPAPQSTVEIRRRSPRNPAAGGVAAARSGYGCWRAEESSAPAVCTCN